MIQNFLVRLDLTEDKSVGEVLTSVEMLCGANVVGAALLPDYVIHRSEYGSEGPYFLPFIGTFRQLLEAENGVTDENRDDPFDKDGKEVTIADLADEDLINAFDDANGDGQPYSTVWSVVESRKVLG